MSVMIGVEVHAQLNTASKIFCSDSTDHRDKEPNQNTCPICLGFPGSKPKLNKKVLEYGLMIGMALNCKVTETVFFSRKTYFYPDLSKNYQITQYEAPLTTEGYLTTGEDKVRIRRVHIEEDPAKLMYVNGDITSSEYVHMDYNRAGVPLAEIVTEPDFTSPKQVRAFLEQLSSILEHLGVYDSAKEATLRVDANISIDGGERVEVKNITGFENVEKALNYEIVRQNGLKRMEVEIQRETRHFDAEMKTTKSLRKKEYEEDYGYIFDPDLPTVTISKAMIATLKKNMPELPDQRVQRFVRDYGTSEYTSHVLVYTDKNLADFFEQSCKLYPKPDIVANWLMNYILKSLNWRSEKIRSSKVKPDTFVEMLTLIEKGTLSERYAKELVKEYVDTGTSPGKLLERGGAEVTTGDIEQIVKNVVGENKKAVDEFKSGRKEAMQFLIGKVLAQSGKKGD
ncbi:MAG TPA: Asp-tRNA(Asn)/Glu-tRNA(Gln) amidotransferase subunit GatB, partial [Candidatus Acidoferrales bacterium]|nr:Asp-tRNA(Asn)/Glu-tRNA(Gln) amidotransferase subunit GatB [Candidatus Acidoferrales bacterium]